MEVSLCPRWSRDPGAPNAYCSGWPGAGLHSGESVATLVINESDSIFLSGFLRGTRAAVNLLGVPAPKPQGGSCAILSLPRVT